jgi:hypothetical protein
MSIDLFLYPWATARKWNVNSRKWNQGSILGWRLAVGDWSANGKLLTANRKRLTFSLFRLQPVVPEKIHELLVMVRLDIEENAHPSVAASSRQ